MKNCQHEYLRALSLKTSGVLLATYLIATPVFAQGGIEQASAVGSELMDVLAKGGWVMWVIIALSVLGMALVFERFVALRGKVLFDTKLAESIRTALAKKELGPLIPLLKSADSPMSRMLLAGLMQADDSAELAEKSMEVRGNYELARLRRPVRPLATLASVEPLLGLLGTILGMIGTFNILHTTSAAERVTTLAPGIGQALYTTAAGLIVAIPFVIAHHHFNARIDRAAEEWSILGNEVLAAKARTVSGMPTSAKIVVAAGSDEAQEVVVGEAS